MNRPICWILFLLIWFYRRNSVHGFTSALCFLTKKADFETFYFAEELGENLRQDNLDIYVVIDKHNFDDSSMKNLTNIQILNITTEQCISYGYSQTTRLGDDRYYVTAWDKALLHFCVFNKVYSFVWFIEDDVFIPSVNAFRSIHRLYSTTNDLVVRDSQLNLLGKTSYWLWYMAFGNFIPPWSHTMVNVAGLSRRMLESIAREVHWRGVSLFHEYFFLTLALQLNMTIVLPSELSTLHPSGQYLWNNIAQRPNNLWHPVKKPIERRIWRTRLENEIFKTKLHINVNDLKVLSENDSNMETIAKDLQKWLFDFEISKVDLSLEDRYLIRRYALDLVDKYQNKTDAFKIISLANKLANDAYRIPERPIDPLIQNKSSNHIEIEKTLEKTKADIVRLLSNTSDQSTVDKLRKVSKFLVFDLTYEIRREMKRQPISSVTTIHVNQRKAKPIQRKYFLSICLFISTFYCFKVLRKRCILFTFVLYRKVLHL